MYDFENHNLPTYVNEPISGYLNPNHDERLRNSHVYRLPRSMSHKFARSTIPDAIKSWETLPIELKSKYTRNSFKFSVRIFLHGKKSNSLTSKLDLERKLEIYLNRTRCDFIFKAHLFSHNFVGITDPSCQCGHRQINTGHLFYNCPLLTDRRTELFLDLGKLPSFLNVYSTVSGINRKLNILLFGHESFSSMESNMLFILVANFISKI